MEKIKKIMIADDDPGIVDAVSMMLEFEGYDVASTMNGSLLLGMTSDLPDLLLLDIWMSGEDGRDICKQLKDNRVTRGIPVILVSASTDLRKSAEEAGANDFLEKPFEMNDLLGKIDRLLNGKMTAG
ncbi:response regulator [Hufsiella ginkgonis]|uniref:Response regulator n=1 Tax=Hufsiella ginkgonis TaxID=2695274 RepID=A0A7K1Y345_9SPHI|nr:response regulator [Hufsiella ginkgonis]MXV17106.1 response regulator [Hufsiella ginkgonis]